MELVNKFDNALTGVAGDPGETGVIVNHGNVIETGRYWQMEPCDEHDHSHDHGHGNEHVSDRQQINLHDDGGTPDEVTGRDSLAGAILEVTGTSGAAPAVPRRAPLQRPGPDRPRRARAAQHHGQGDDLRPRPHERPGTARGDGRHRGGGLLRRDLQPQLGRQDRLPARLPGRRRGHPYGRQLHRVRQRLGEHRGWADERFTFGFGFGSDINGFASQGAPRNPDTDAGEVAVTYPFTGFGGVEIDRQVSGERTFDINTDGVAHYGLYPDWVEDLRVLAGDEIIEDLERGPEAYLQMWERAVGIEGDACRNDVDDLTVDDLEQLEAGMSPEEVLLALGQPTSRQGSEFVYCLDEGHATVHFDADGLLDHVDVEDEGDTDRPGGPPEDRPGHGPPDGAGGPPDDHGHMGTGTDTATGMATITTLRAARSRSPTRAAWWMAPGERPWPRRCCWSPA
jgi:hypothetical protein